jgi:hypothetical protein
VDSGRIYPCAVGGHLTAGAPFLLSLMSHTTASPACVQSRGYILLHRSLLLDAELLWEPGRARTLLEAWLMLIALAAYRTRTLVVNRAVVTLKRGELLVASRGLETLFDWRSSERVARFLKILIDAGRITKQRVTPGGTIFLITGYERYQNPAGPSSLDTNQDSEQDAEQGTEQGTEQVVNQDPHQDKNNAGDCRGNQTNAVTTSAAPPRDVEQPTRSSAPAASSAGPARKPRRAARKPRRAAISRRSQKLDVPAHYTARLVPLGAALRGRFPALADVAVEEQLVVATIHTQELFSRGATPDEVGQQAVEYLKAIDTIAHIGWPRFLRGYGEWGNTAEAAAAGDAKAVNAVYGRGGR